MECFSLSQRRSFIEPSHNQLSILRQCALLGLARSSYYYQAIETSTENLAIMTALDKQYLKTPFYGVPRMTQAIKDLGYLVNHKRIARLMKLMCISAIYPKKNLSVSDQSHKVYPYLLRNTKIEFGNQVWSTDITARAAPLYSDEKWFFVLSGSY